MIHVCICLESVFRINRIHCKIGEKTNSGTDLEDESDSTQSSINTDSWGFWRLTDVSSGVMREDGVFHLKHKQMNCTL